MQGLSLRANVSGEALLPDSPELRSALSEANTPTMLAAYVWLTHDQAMLEAFRPLIKPAFSWPPTEIPLGVGEKLAERVMNRSVVVQQKVVSLGTKLTHINNDLYK